MNSRDKAFALLWGRLVEMKKTQYHYFLQKQKIRTYNISMSSEELDKWVLEVLT
jgi:hypothetical protein